MALKKFVKDPGAVLDYTIDWSAWLAPGDTISSVDTEADTGITVDSSANTTEDTTIWVSGGEAGTTYNVVVHIVTSAGREDERTLQFQIKDK